MITFKAKVIGHIDNGQGRWNSQKIGVFRVDGDREEQVGEYTRNYPNIYSTFCHFRSRGKDFALFSPDYTCTRIMSLPDCKDIGGEEPDGHGFCPVELYVPSYVSYEMEFDGRDGKRSKSVFQVWNPKPSDIKSRLESGSRLITDLCSTPFGFIAGCVWGDDSSWKIEYLDLKDAHEGKLVREQRFGYIELPSKMSLRDAIDVDSLDDDSEDQNITIATQSYYKLKTGERLNG